MHDTIEYLNTDLVLTAPQCLTGLAESLSLHGLWTLAVVQGEDGLWHASFETDTQFSEPEPNIAAMLTAIEQLDNAEKEIWADCYLREFNMGYDCGAEPWAFNQGLSNLLLARLAAAGASLRWTLYPDRSKAVDDRC